MPTPGLSLVGFLADHQQAVNHLTNACIPANPDVGAILIEWNAAMARLGAAMIGAGVPDIQPIPAQHQVYIQQVLAHPAFQPPIPGMPTGALHGATIELVEIDPLLAFQFTVDMARSNHHCGHLSAPPTMDELLPVCLPLTPATDEIKMNVGPQSAIIRSKSLNLRSLVGGVFNGQFMGLHFGPSLPFVQVVRHNGRCYLHNGYHRAFGARRSGATHIPCVVRNVADHAAVGINDGFTFSAQLMESPNPPTLAHFTQGRALAVSLRFHSRVLHVSWAEYAVAEE